MAPLCQRPSFFAATSWPFNCSSPSNMLERELRDCLDAAADAALVISRHGRIAYANPAAQLLFGSAPQALAGASCAHLLQGAHPGSGKVCAEPCPILQQALNGNPIPAFDFEAHTASGLRWLNVSTLTLRLANGFVCLHLFRDVDHQMHIQRAAHQLAATVENTSRPAPFPTLTDQEQRILELLALGHSTRQMADSLAISPTTVRNHLQHIMRKLNVHSRIEAVLRSANRPIRLDAKPSSAPD